jgi:hypothetical protein
MPESEPPVGVPGVDGVNVFARPYDWPPERKDGGQCMDCGFLAKRSVDPSRPGVEEVTVEERKAGRLLKFINGARIIPWCFVRSSKEARGSGGTCATPFCSRRQARVRVAWRKCRIECWS